MNCPACNRNLPFSLSNREKISDGIEHIFGICPYCKEIIHFIYHSSENQVIGWVESREKIYSKEFNQIRSKNALYISSIESEQKIRETCSSFSAKYGWDSCFFVRDNGDDLSALKKVYSIFILNEILFPEIPSYLAERIIVNNFRGNLYSTESTFLNRFTKI